MVKTTGNAVGIAEEIPSDTIVKSMPEKSTNGVPLTVSGKKSPPFRN